MEKRYFTKYGCSPIFGDDRTVFDAYVRPQTDGKLRMDFSWRPQKSLALTHTEDGIHGSDPVITLSPDQQRCLMWYTGQANGHSWIGVAESADGVHFATHPGNPIFTCKPRYFLQES